MILGLPENEAFCPFPGRPEADVKVGKMSALG